MSFSGSSASRWSSCATTRLEISSLISPPTKTTRSRSSREEMSNERSPRASCWTTMGTSGMMCNLRVAGCHQRTRCATMWLLMPCVRREVVLPVDPERAWELITEPDELEGWLADEVELEPEEGG